MKTAASPAKPAPDGSDVFGPVGAGHGPAAVIRELARDLMRQRRLPLTEASRIEAALRDHDWPTVRTLVEATLARRQARPPGDAPADGTAAPGPAAAAPGAPSPRTLPLAGEAPADAAVHEALLHIIYRLCDALPQLAASDPGLPERLGPVRALLASRLTVERVAEAQARLAAIVEQQIAFQQGLQDARTSVTDMLAMLVDRLSRVGRSTARFKSRIDGQRATLQGAPGPAALAQVVDALLAATNDVAEEIEQSQQELAEARRKVESYELRVRTLEHELANAARMVQNDPLTHALNRRGLDEVFRVEVSRAVRYGVPLTVVMLDLDDFKAINDSLGHAAGDRALIHFVTTGQACLRSTERIARTGGEEFVVVFPATPVESAVDAVRRLQRELARNVFLHDGQARVMTFSGGATTWLDGESLAQTLQRADAAMYGAKRAGKNRIVIG